MTSKIACANQHERLAAFAGAEHGGMAYIRGIHFPTIAWTRPGANHLCWHPHDDVCPVQQWLPVALLLTWQHTGKPVVCADGSTAVVGAWRKGHVALQPRPAAGVLRSAHLTRRKTCIESAGRLPRACRICCRLRCAGHGHMIHAAR